MLGQLRFWRASGPSLRPRFSPSCRPISRLHAGRFAVDAAAARVALARWCKESEAEGDDENSPEDKTAKKKKKPTKKKQSKKPMPKTKKAVAIPPDCEYKAGEYKEARLQYIAVKKDEEGISFEEANEKWKKSRERAKLLKGMSLNELKRRRFI